MVVMSDIHAQGFELVDQLFNFFLVGIPADVPDFFKAVPGHNFINGTSQAIGESDLGFVGRAQSKDPFIIFSPIETPAFHFGILSRLNQDFS